MKSMENLLEILVTPKQVGLLIGAGVSKACGLPNIEDLTKVALEKISNANFLTLVDKDDNIENILNKIQNIKSLLNSENEINGLKENEINSIEKTLKKTIYEQLSISVDYKTLCNLVIWLNYVNQDHEKEIFTLNYDLLIEKALEEQEIPYFSGFVGNVKSFFVPDSVDDFNGQYVKKSWTKLWKLHGSLNFKKSGKGKLFIENYTNTEYQDLLIYPSMDKYLSSRKAPFISYMDRLRKYLIDQEKILIILGYSFGDQHINDLVLNGLNGNPRLSVISFAYDDTTYNRAKEIIGIYPNVSIYTDKKKYINKEESVFSHDKNIGDFNNFIKVLDSLVSPNITTDLNK